MSLILLVVGTLVGPLMAFVLCAKKKPPPPGIQKSNVPAVPAPQPPVAVGTGAQPKLNNEAIAKEKISPAAKNDADPEPDKILFQKTQKSKSVKIKDDEDTLKHVESLKREKTEEDNASCSSFIHCTLLIVNSNVMIGNLDRGLSVVCGGVVNELPDDWIWSKIRVEGPPVGAKVQVNVYDANDDEGAEYSAAVYTQPTTEEPTTMQSRLMS
ncbi:hypothetical protein M3Y96_00535600 [Aphelenchoides besseyi]|nr:hypothetical protein M3Y96_00535600 [Aphelenchoides besseyi]